jgi:hypothetical protein
VQKLLITIGLLVLVLANGTWAIILMSPTPVLGAAVYVVVAVQVLRRAEYRAAFFVGVAGAVLHLIEYLRRSGRVPGSDAWFLAANVVLPAVVSVLALRAWRRELANTPRGAGS